MLKHLYRSLSEPCATPFHFLCLDLVCQLTNKREFQHVLLRGVCNKGIFSSQHFYRNVILHSN